MNNDDKVIEIMGIKYNQHWAEQLLDVCKTTSVISDEQISLDLPEKYKPEFEEFMRGKTCPILDNGQRGVYSWDFEQYLKTIPRTKNKNMDKKDTKELEELKKHCNIGICIAIISVIVNVFNMIIAWSKVL